MSPLLVLFAVGLLPAFVTSRQLPSYIKPCKLSDPKFNECAKRNGNEAISSLLKGDKTYKIPSFNPYKISQVNLEQEDLKLSMMNMSLEGLNTVRVQEANFDPENRNIHIQIFIPECQLHGEYKVNGKLAAFVLEGEGPAEITMANITLDQIIDYNLIKKKDGKQYLDTDHLKTNSSCRFEKVHYNFENLFGNNKALGDKFNSFLNENSEEIKGLALQIINGIIKTATETILRGLLGTTPENEIFLT